MRKAVVLAFACLMLSVPAQAQYSGGYSGGGCLLAGCTMTGPILFSDGTAAAPSISFASNPSTGWYLVSEFVQAYSMEGSPVYALSDGNIRLRSIGSYQWASTTTPTDAADVFLYRDAANTLALRNTTAAQTFRVYDTHTDASNYERVYLGFVSNVAHLGTENAGTGSAQPLHVHYGATLFSALGTPADGTTLYCSDCAKATPCTGSSTGAFAKRIAGAWDCD